MWKNFKILPLCVPRVLHRLSNFFATPASLDEKTAVAGGCSML